MINDSGSFPKSIIKYWYDKAKAIMQNQQIDYNKAVSIFDQYHIANNNDILKKVSLSDNNKKVSIKELAMMLFLMDGIKSIHIKSRLGLDNSNHDKNIEFDRNVETSQYYHSRENLTNTITDEEYDEILKAFDEYENSDVNSDYSNEEIESYVSMYNKALFSENVESHKDIGRLMFGENFKGVAVTLNGEPIFLLNDSTSIAFMNIMYPNGTDKDCVVAEVRIIRPNREVEYYKYNNDKYELVKIVKNTKQD